ncbi:MAG: hypothetical protein MOB07_23280 [Acidobacteria bacterium]|nr:hypothetical protein [Acidobacteriota bacterium]
MPTTDKNLRDLTRGNAVTLRFLIKTSVDLALARFVAKRSRTDADNSVVSKVVTTTLSADGQITDPGGPDGQAEVKIFLTITDSMVFKAALDYVWDLEVFDGASKPTTPVGGLINFDDRVRTATGP